MYIEIYGNRDMALDPTIGVQDTDDDFMHFRMHSG